MHPYFLFLLISDSLIYDEADDSSKTGASISNIGSPNVLPSSLFIAVLQEIGRRCESKVLCLSPTLVFFFSSLLVSYFLHLFLACR